MKPIKRRVIRRYIMNPPRQHEPLTITVTLYPPKGGMDAQIGNRRIVSVLGAVDPEARAFAEGIRQAIVQLMQGDDREWPV